MLNEYPKMLYKYPGTDLILKEGSFATLVVDKEAEEVEAVADGWYLTSTEAKDPPKINVDKGLNPDGTAKTAWGAKV